MVRTPEIRYVITSRVIKISHSLKNNFISGFLLSLIEFDPSDCSDYEVYRSGLYVPGFMGALFALVDQVIGALATIFVGGMVALIGFTDMLPQVEDILTGELEAVTIPTNCLNYKFKILPVIFPENQQNILGRIHTFRLISCIFSLSSQSIFFSTVQNQSATVSWCP